MSASSNPPILVNQLPIAVEIPSDPSQIQEILSLLYKRIANAVNAKEGSLYSLQEFGNFQLYFIPTNPNAFRNGYRKVFDMVSLNGGTAIAPGATVTFAHGISGITQTTRIYGSATNSDSPIKYIPLPYVSATLITSQVQIYLTPTNVVLINGSTQTALTSATIVAEFLKT